MLLYRKLSTSSSSSELIMKLINSGASKEIIKSVIDIQGELSTMKAEKEKAEQQAELSTIKAEKEKAEQQAEMNTMKAEKEKQQAELKTLKAEKEEQEEFLKTLYCRGFQELFEKELANEIASSHPGIAKFKRDKITGHPQVNIPRERLFDLVEKGFAPNLLKAMNSCNVFDVKGPASALYKSESIRTHDYFKDEFAKRGLEYLELPEKYAKGSKLCSFFEKMKSYAFDNGMAVVKNPREPWVAGGFSLMLDIIKEEKRWKAVCEGKSRKSRAKKEAITVGQKSAA